MFTKCLDMESRICCGKFGRFFENVFLWDWIICFKSSELKCLFFMVDRKCLHDLKVGGDMLINF